MVIRTFSAVVGIAGSIDPATGIEMQLEGVSLVTLTSFLAKIEREALSDAVLNSLNFCSESWLAWSV